MTTFSFDVEVSNHDALKEGVTALRLKMSQNTWHRIVVEAETRSEASLLAHGMAACHGDVMVMAIYDRI